MYIKIKIFRTARRFLIRCNISILFQREGFVFAISFRTFNVRTERFLFVRGFNTPTLALGLLIVFHLSAVFYRPSYTTYTPPQRQTGRIKNRRPAAAGRFRFFRIGQAEDIRAVHKKNLAVKLISGVLKNNYRYSAWTYCSPQKRLTAEVRSIASWVS